MESYPMTEAQGEKVIALLNRIEVTLLEVHLELLNIKARVGQIEGQLEKRSEHTDVAPPPQ
jgi:hypothetical protein